MDAPSTPLLEVTGLQKSFATGEGAIEVLRDLELCVGRGEMLAILGESGVGKSTLLHVLGTLDHPTAGSVRFEGRDLFEYRKLGFTARRAKALEDAVAALHAAGFAHGDLGRHDVIFRPDGTAVLFDFATAVGPGTPPLLWRLLLPLWKTIDRRRVRRLVGRYTEIREKRRAARRERVSRPKA